MRGVAAPAKVGSVPAVELLLPVGKEFGVIGRPPVPCDRVALEIDIDPSLLRFRDELLVGNSRSSRRSTAVNRSRIPQCFVDSIEHRFWLAITIEEQGIIDAVPRK